MTLAVVFGGGGARGAFQAGVWATIAKYVNPRFVIGSSIGAINGWATTRLTPEALVSWWLTQAPSALPPYRLAGLRPVLTDLLALPQTASWPALAVCTPVGQRLPHVVTLTPDNGLAWLLASSALPGWYAPRRIGQQWYVDGGVKNDLPVAIARELGATKVIAISAAGLGPKPAIGDATVISPSEKLTSMLDFSLVNRRALVAQGRRAGVAWLRRERFA
ncbi:patatin-like phospholipase family protein [Lacticaseibacillus sp. GG6-2]